jgi:hypothetical protein
MGLEEEDEEGEDVEFCAYTIVGAAFKTAMAISPAIPTPTNPTLKKNFGDNRLCLSIMTLSIKPRYKV